MILLLSFLFAALPLSSARWATKEDASSKTVSFKIDVRVEPQQSVYETEMVLEVLKEAGRDAGTWRYSYNPETTSVKIVEAYTITRSRKTSVAKSAIVDKPIQNSTQGFDQLNEILLSFPNVEVGSRLVLKIETIVTKYGLKVFNWHWGFGGLGLIESAEFKVTSHKKLFMESNDPRASLDILTSQKNGSFYYSFKTKKSIFESIIDEDAPILRSQNSTWVKFSEVETYTELPKNVLPDYEKVIQGPLPALHKKVLASAKGNSTVDIINSLTSALHQRVRYMGDWRGVRGTHIPRALSEVAKHASGDCKDYSASLVAMLREKKINSYVAFVWSQNSMAPELGKIPDESVFNHAIVAVEHEGKTLWVDPTDPRSFAQGIPPHLLNRQALILDPKGARLAQIPAVSPAAYKVDDVFFYDVSNLDKVNVKVDMAAFDGGSYAWTLWSEYASAETIQRDIARSLFAESELLQFNFTPTDFSKRAVSSELRVNGNLRVRPQLVRTSEGQGLYFKAMRVVDEITDLVISERQSDYYWDTPMQIKKVSEVKGRSVRGRELKGCRIKSHWFDYERLYQEESNRYLIQEDFNLKTSLITHADMKNREFVIALESLRHCTQRIVLIF